MRKKIVAAVASTVLMFTFTGCTGSDEPEPVAPTATVTQEVTPTVPETTEPVEPETTEPEIPEEDVDQLYVDVLRQNYPFFNDVPDATLVDFAETTCQAFDEGATLQDIFVVIEENAQNRNEAEAFAFAVGAAVPAYCPEHTDKISGLDSGSAA